MIAIDQAVEDFFFHCRYEKNLTEKTLKAYGTDLEQFIDFLNLRSFEGRVAEIDKHLVRAFLKQLAETSKPRTVKRKIATLRAFFNFLEFEDQITVSPFRKLRIKIIQEQNLPVVLTLAEVRQLFSHLYHQLSNGVLKTNSKKHLLVRDIAVIEMLFATGMRVSELCKLKLADTDLTTGSVRIRGKGRRERIVPLCEPKVLASLQRYLKIRPESFTSDGFFINPKGSRITEQNVRLLVEKHTRAAGLKQKITPHTFRHTVATLLLENGIDIRNIQHLLGHSTITTTQIYVKVNARSQRQILEKAHPRLLIEI